MRQSGISARARNNKSTSRSIDERREAISLSTRSFDAGAVSWVLITPKPFGVSTRSSEGTASAKARRATTAPANDFHRSGSGSSSCPVTDSSSQACAEAKKGDSLENIVASPITVSTILGSIARNCASSFISFSIGRGFRIIIDGNFLCVLVFVKGCKLNKRTFRVNALPSVIPDDYIVDLE